MEMMDVLFSRDEIKKRIPHRDPFLFLDDVVKFDRESQSIVCRWRPAPDEWFFQGHFPGFPITPGVLIVESLAQAAGMYAMLEVEKYHNKPFFFASIEKVRFKKPVQPGTQLFLNATLLKKSMNFWRFETKACAEEGLCAEAVIMATMQS